MAAGFDSVLVDQEKDNSNSSGSLSKVIKGELQILTRSALHFMRCPLSYFPKSCEIKLENAASRLSTLFGCQFLPS